MNPGIALKELLENALDAKATNIDIRIQDQGLKSISVSDNGTGVKEVDFESLSKRSFFISTYYNQIKRWQKYHVCSHNVELSSF